MYHKEIGLGFVGGSPANMGAKVAAPAPSPAPATVASPAPAPVTAPTQVSTPQPAPVSAPVTFSPPAPVTFSPPAPATISAPAPAPVSAPVTSPTQAPGPQPSPVSAPPGMPQAEIAELLAKINALLGTTVQLPASEAPVPAEIPKPALPEGLDSVYRKFYDSETLTEKQAAFMACEAISLGEAGLEVLTYLHKHYKFTSRHILACGKGKDDPMDILPNFQPLDQRWLAAPGILSIIKYLHTELNMRKADFKRMRYFDIFMILVSGNIDLLQYFYSLGFQQRDFMDDPHVSPVGNWGYNQDDGLSIHSQEFLDKYAPMGHSSLQVDLMNDSARSRIRY